MTSYFMGALFLLTFVGGVFAHDPATHMYIGSQTFDIWQDFDPDFHSTLMSDSDHGRMTRKFYYIGLTLPDMFDYQNEIRTLVNEFYDKSDFFRWALYIQDHTYSNVQTEITFDTFPPPNTNLTKLREMVEYAKGEGWYAAHKALIYGAYMHVVHDLYAHMVLQPGRFGYGFAIEADSALSEGILFYPEIYYEVFASTDIPDWDFL